MSNTTQVIQTKSPPLYQRIQQEMRTRIARGGWADGQPLPSRVQLCREFGTTRVTLDKAIHELVREGLLRSAKGSGTFIAAEVNNSANKTSARALRVGIIMGRAATNELLDKPGRDNLYFGPLFQGIRDAVAGQAVDMVHAHYDQPNYGTFYRNNMLDGFLLITPLLNELPTLHALADAEVPFVAVGMSSHLPADAALPFVDTDNRQGAQDAVNHLLALGHTQIAIVNLATSQANHYDRLEGYRSALAASGLPMDLKNLLLYPIYELNRLDERIEEWLRPLLASGRLPTAIFTTDYQMAISTIHALRRNQVRVPEDISVVGFDDPFSAEHLTPALTTVRQPLAAVGHRSALRLLDALRSGELPRGLEMLSNRLVVRHSTCPVTERNYE